MEFDNSPASASVEVMVVQEKPLNQQIEIPVSSKCKLMLELLEKFVAEVSSDVMTEIQVQPEFRRIIRNLHEKAPDATQSLATTILEYGSTNDGGDDIQDKSVKHARRKTTSRKDLSYKPPKSAKVKTKEVKDLGKVDLQQTGSSLDRTDHQVFPGPHDTSVDAGNCQVVLRDHDAGDEVRQSAIKSPEPSKGVQGGETEPHTSEDVQIAMEDSARAEMATDRQGVGGTFVKEVTPEARNPGASNEGGDQTDTVGTHATRPQEPPIETAAPVTPAQQVDKNVFISPKTKEIHREKIPTSIESISSSPSLSMASNLTKVTTKRDMIVEAARVIYGFSKYQHGVPKTVYTRILQTMRSHKEPSNPPNLGEWSDGSMWMQVLEAGWFQNQKITILNMLEYIGAWEWYDAQVKLTQATIRTKKNKPVDRRGAAIHVLNGMQGLLTTNDQYGKCIRNVGRITLGEERNESCDLADDSITEKNTQLMRRRINMQLSRGNKLSTKLVKELGLGILFSPKIWEYTKMETKQLDSLIEDAKANSNYMQLLRILGQQLEVLINEGKPDLNTLFSSLRAETLVSEEEYKELTTTFALEAGSTPKGSLDAAVDRLIEEVSTKVMGKRKLEKDDGVAIDGGIELPCDMLNRLRQGEWFDGWLLMAGMAMSDKPYFVRYGYSVPLEQFEPSGRSGKMRRVAKPLAGWRKKIEAFRTEAQEQQGGEIRLIYFCPLNCNSNHFTLLEINEQEEKIYHYDSMASKSVIDGTERLSRVGKLVQEEFGHLEFEYIEAPTPQQRDASSCGPMVVRNSAHRMNGLQVGDWHDELDPERLRIDIVKAFETCILDNALQRKRAGNSAGSNGMDAVPKDDSTKAVMNAHRRSKRLKA